MRRVLALLIVVFWALCPAKAHDPRMSSITLRLEATGLLGTIIVPEERLVGEITLESVRDQVLPQVQVLADGSAVGLEATEIARGEDRKTILLSVLAAWPRLPEQLTIHGPLFAEVADSRTLNAIYRDGTLIQQTVTDSSHAELKIVLSQKLSVWESAIRFFREGLHHISVGPDHLLFVVGLLLLGGTLKQTLKIVTAFTVAHSITLACAALGWFTPSARVIEPLIALSIVCVGAENLVAKAGQRDLRTLLAFGFGFVHGFGFAGPLQEAGLRLGNLAVPLVSFNLGVEAGQAMVVVALVPILGAIARRNPKLRRTILVVGSVLVMVCGAFWFVQRIT